MLILSPADLAGLGARLRRRALCCRWDDYRPTFLARRVASRLKATGCSDVPAYLARLDRDPEEAGRLAAKLQIPTTEFFRNPEVFDALGRLLSERTTRRGWSPLTLVSAPCSTGEEAFSLAVLMAERRFAGRVVALDLAETSLRTLRNGAYPRRALEKLDLRRHRRYFRSEGEVFRAADSLGERILPVRCDLCQGLPVRGAHGILMRNLFIYLTAEAQARAVEAAAEALVPGGLLVLGRTETLPARWRHDWAPLDRAARIYEWSGRGR